MRTQPELHDISPELVEGMVTPQSFIEQNYCPQELADELGVTIDELWLGVREGLIPRGVWLPVNPPMPCWDAQFISEWIHAGKPPCELHMAHQKIVFTKLIAAVRGSLSAFPPTVTERN